MASNANIKTFGEIALDPTTVVCVSNNGENSSVVIRKQGGDDAIVIPISVKAATALCTHFKESSQ